MLSFSERAVSKMNSRNGPTPNWYLDMKAIQKYLVVKEGGKMNIIRYKQGLSCDKI